jgi:predicted metal-dependent HD superfamily phosphohydrolase
MREVYEALLKRRGAKNPSPYYKRLEAAYSPPHRKYHNLKHIEQGLGELLQAPIPEEYRDAVLFSWFHHDEVYNLLNPLNELMSAQSALQVIDDCSLWLTRDVVSADICASDHKRDPPTQSAMWLLDADLSIFGQSWKDFLKYDDEIREEYSVVPDEVFFPNRRTILKFFRDKETLYHTAHFKEKYDAKARKNLDRVIAQRYLGNLPFNVVL